MGVPNLADIAGGCPHSSLEGNTESREKKKKGKRVVGSRGGTGESFGLLCTLSNI